ncbi:MAG: MMPL family transporter [Actinomycetota bacterium]|nr:MMPL family transporter [Actinomycetota bacterium]
MFDRLAVMVSRRRRWVLAVTVVASLLAGVFGGGVVDLLSSGGFEDPGAESVLAAEALEGDFGAREPNLILLVSAPDSVDDPQVAEAGLKLTEELAGEAGLEGVLSYWSTGAPSLVSDDGSQALVLGTITGSEERVDDRIAELGPGYRRNGSLIDVEVGGPAQVFQQVSATVEEDLVRAETIAFPITLILLVLVFGSLVSALLPLIVGGIAIVGALAVLRIITGFTDVSVFALNLVTMLGLGLAIDYSLFVVSRFREELAGGHEPREAIARTVRTAGKTVAFSALTVALSLAALMVFPLYFLRSFAYAGIAVVILAAAVAIVFLPALLVLLGPRIDSLSFWKRRTKPVGEGFWHTIATGVMRRPIPFATIVIALLLVFGAPFLGVDWGSADDRVLPAEASSRVVSDEIRTNFSTNEAASLSVVAPGFGDPSQRTTDIEGYASDLSQIDGVAAVSALTGTYANGQRVAPPDASSRRFTGVDGTWLSVGSDREAYSAAGEAVVSDIRSLDAPFRTQVAGQSADLVDLKQSLFDRVPIAGGLIAVTTFVLLFLVFGSVLVPIKAIVLNLLSLTATFGVAVWVFQEGHLSGALDFTATGSLEVTSAILMFCIAFGLSMDYEVFLLSRIKEEYDRTGDNTRSVAMGLERTGRIVTAAAVLISVVFVLFGTSGVSIIKLIGIGLTLAVLMDATLVRAILVPAFMRLAGRANWWAPAWMRKVHNRFGLSEGTAEAGPVVRTAPEGGVS